MPDNEEKEKKRPLWKVKRIQGLIVMAAGAVMLLIPATAPAAPTVIQIGTIWAGVGVIDKSMIKQINTLNK